MHGFDASNFKWYGYSGSRNFVTDRVVYQFDPNLPRRGFHETTDSSSDVLTPGYFKALSGVRIGDVIDIIITDNLDSSLRTTASFFQVQVIDLDPTVLVQIITTGGGLIGNVLENLAQLKGADLAVSSFAMTLGYFVGGDGGSGIYEIVPGGTGTADDAFFANMVNGNQAKLHLPDPTRMHVRQLGCIADGVTNDTARIVIGEASPVTDFDLGGLSVKTTLVTNVGNAALLKRYDNGTLNGVSYIDGQPFFIKEQSRIRDTSLIQDRTKSPVLDFVRDGIKRVLLWNATSIAHQGLDVDSFPLLACTAIGVDLVNMAWPGSHASFNILEDPNDSATTAALSMTEDDRLWGVAAHPGSAYDDSDPGHPASEMTADFRIKAPFEAAWNGGAGEPITVAVLDHNHNDRGRAFGTLTPESHSITAVALGVTTQVTLSAAGTVAVGDAVAIEVVGMGILNHFAGRVQAKVGLTITLNLDSSSVVETFASGTLYKYDRATIYGAWEFLFRYYLNCSIRFGHGDVKIITANSFSEYSHGIDDRLFFPNSIAIKRVTDKYRSLFGPRFAFFDIAHEMAMTLIDQGTYAGDLIHPTEVWMRQAIANYWAGWFMGGLFITRPVDYWLPAGVDKDYADQAPAHYSRFLAGFGTVKRFIGDATIIYSNDFSAGLGAGWTAVGTLPVAGAAPWGGGESAIHCVAPANGSSAVSRAITIGIGRKIEFDFWLPQVTGFASNPTNQLITLWSMSVPQAYYIFRLNIRFETTNLLMRYFKSPGVDLFSMLPQPATNLQPNTKYRLRCEMYGGLSGDNKGAFLIYLDDRLVGGPYVVKDSSQTPITSVLVGAASSNLGDPLEVYIGNLTVSELATYDVSSRYTGNVNIGGNQFQIVNGMVINVL